jgi:hypothetical protein
MLEIEDRARVSPRDPLNTRSRISRRSVSLIT